MVRLLAYDQTTGVLKFWQDRTIAGFNTVGTAQTDQLLMDITQQDLLLTQLLVVIFNNCWW
jgi:hypothetical protein